MPVLSRRYVADIADEALLSAPGSAGNAEDYRSRNAESLLEKELNDDAPEAEASEEDAA